MKTEKLAPLVVGSYDMTRLEQVVRLTSRGDKPLSFKWIKVQRTQLLHLNSAAAKSLQSCPTLCDPTDGSPPGSAVPGILQARTLEWVI